MGTLEQNTTLIYGIHLRESANDGSDFSNGATDYRILFLGEDGQLHVKDSAGTVSDIGAGSGIPPTLFDAKGDLIAASAADTAARLAAGANQTMLVANSAQSTGLEWVALQAGKVKRSAGDVTTTSTSLVDVTGMSVTLTTGARRCLVAAIINGTVNNSAGTMAVELDIDGTDQGGTDGMLSLGQHSVASETMNFSFTFLTDVLTAASHTFKLQFKVFNAAHTGTIYGSSSLPCILSVAELPIGV